MNDISALDRAMQTVKRDMAADVADGDAANWGVAICPAVSAHNSRPHSAVYGPPEEVEEIGVQDFRIFQDNARQFSSNAMHSKGRKQHCRKLVLSGLQQKIQGALNHNMGMYRC